MKHQVTLRNIWITMSALCSGTGMELKVVKRSTAGCDGHFMYIPSHWVYTSDPEIENMLLGIVVHEAMGHGRYTNFDQYKTYSDQTSEMGRSILNIFEDIYIETKCNAAKPGASNALAKMVTILTSKEFFGNPEKIKQLAIDNPASVVVSGLLILGRARLLPGQDVPLAQNASTLEVILDDILGPLWDQIWDIAKNASKSTCTEDSINLTKQVLALIANQSSDKPQPDGGCNRESAPSDQQDESQTSGSNEENQAVGEEENADAVQGSSGDKGSAEDAKSKSPSADAEVSDDNCNPEISDQDVTEEAERNLEKGHKAAKAIENAKDQKMPTTEISDMASREVDKFARSCSHGIINMDLSPRKMLMSDKSGQIATTVKSISDDLQDALLAETRCVRSNRMVGKRLNGRVLSRIRMGNPNVFIRKDVGEGLSTAVSLLLDDSGSMGNMKDWTSGLSFGLGDILDEFEVPMEIAVYSDSLAYAKTFEEDWTNFRKRRQVVHFGGSTVTGGAAELVLGSLACRDEDRRLLILVTDGDTCDMDRLESVYAEALHQDIEIASVMLGHVIPKIERLANKFGFEAKSCMRENDLARYVLGRILQAI